MAKIDLSNESKLQNITWDEATWTWNEATSTWNQPRYVLTRESKSKVDLTKGETKSKVDLTKGETK